MNNEWSWKLIQKNSNDRVCHENYDEEMKEKKIMRHSCRLRDNKYYKQNDRKYSKKKIYLKSGFLATAILSSAISEDLILCHFI